MHDLGMLIFGNKVTAAILILALTYSTGVSLVCYQLFRNRRPSLEDFVTSDDLTHFDD